MSTTAKNAKVAVVGTLMTKRREENMKTDAVEKEIKDTTKITGITAEEEVAVEKITTTTTTTTTGRTVTAVRLGMDTEQQLKLAVVKIPLSTIRVGIIRVMFNHTGVVRTKATIIPH